MFSSSSSAIRAAGHIAFLGVVLSAWSRHVRSFSPISPLSSARPSAPSRAAPLSGGTGVADAYSWTEEQFEIEVKVSVPPGTTAGDVRFKCSSDTIDMRLLARGGGADGRKGSEERVLLDGSRGMRGRICVDGTFWSIEGDAGREREITVTIEKHFAPVSSEGGAVTYDASTDFDWGGLYPDDGEEVSRREYDEPEELDVREYAAGLGVDIDNIDMSKVNKTMFGTGLGRGGDVAAAGNDDFIDKNRGIHIDIEQATLDQLTKAGLAKEIVRQGDGSEYEWNTDGGSSEERTFSMLGKDISKDELNEAGLTGGSNTPTLWGEQTIPVKEAPGYRKTHDTDTASSDGIIQNEIDECEVLSNESAAGSSGVMEKVEFIKDTEDKIFAGSEVADPPLEENLSEENPIDPIDILTVAKLKDILRGQGLKVSGKKQVLRDRLRNHINNLLQED